MNLNTQTLHMLSLGSAMLTLTLVMACQPNSAQTPKVDAPKAESNTGAITQPPNDTPKTKKERLVVLGGALTETVYALGLGDQVVGVDTSSVYPEQTQALPKVGYHKRLSAESLLSLNPTQVLLTDEAGPAAALEQLQQAGVTLVQVPSGYGQSKATERIKAIAKALGQEAKGQELVKHIDDQLAAHKASLKGAPTGPKVLFIYARGHRVLLVSGTNTAADEILTLAGAQNAITDFEGFKPLTPEAVIGATPEAILIPNKGLKSIGGIDGLLKLPGLADTPAGKTRKVVTFDDLKLLGFGPRTAEAAIELHKKLNAPQPTQ